MEHFVSYLAFILEITGALYAILELIKLTNDLKKGVYIHDIESITTKDIRHARSHSLKHILSLVLIILTNLYFLFWLLIHAGWNHAIEIHVEGEHLWAFIFLFGIMKLILTQHLKEERLSSYKFLK